MTSSWGYDKIAPDTVQVTVPRDLLDTVVALITDPDGFLASVVQSAQGSKLVHVGDGIYIDPANVVAMVGTIGNYTQIYLAGGHMLETRGTVEEVTERIVGPPE